MTLAVVDCVTEDTSTAILTAATERFSDTQPVAVGSLRSRPPLAARGFALICALASVVIRSDAVKQRFELQIPRVTEAELKSNATLRSGHHAYVLTGVVNRKWAAENWTMEKWGKKINFEWVDFYHNNMADVGSKPHLYKFKDALPLFNQKADKPRYMQLRLSLRGWRRLEKHMSPKPVPDLFWSDEEWISDCMQKDGKPDSEAIDNFFTTNQWKFLLIGEKGTSMFFHKDGTASSSWQAQLRGRKRWTLCPNSESHLLDNHLDTFSEKGQRDPKFSKAFCGQTVVEQGELLYYPGYWWHHTLQLDTPSIAYTGALVGTEMPRDDVGGDRRPHAAFFRDISAKCEKCWKPGQPERTCDDISLKWPGAAPPPLRIVCDTYLPRCFEAWDAHAATLGVDRGRRRDEI
eukprot:TRINITY_DN11518_c0_g1_i2.p1 TRINITY_DN11518_c0_g1~~TRINITY_DN11518_c0_g1_i2.p1  ORF type:complete len:416 (+),score=71.86 TRINITY_DN11518_c0_g1_i2:35-1249(+)